MESAAPTYRAWLLGLALFGATLDQATKYGVFHALYNDGAGDRQALIPGAFDLLTQFTHQQENGTGVLAQLRTVSGDTLPRVNHGALFGMGSTTEGLANTLFAVVSFIAALAILYWSTRPTLARDRWLCIALGLILGGTLGNLYDRIVFGGVRDFLHWYYWVDWPVFNIADCCLVCGAGLLLVQAIFRPAPATEEITNKEEAVAV